jgi:putative FmdB family regulatory protein
MPIYDYKCNTCDAIYEKNVRMSDSGVTQECPECGGMDTTKFIGGAPGITDSFSLGRIKPPDGFRDVLRRIADTTPGSTLRDNCRYI